MIRIGHGFDVHKFGGDNPLILGGVYVPEHQGLEAHSDGDVVLHAVADSILGALGLGDIGRHFPDTDPQFAGADSALLLQQVFQHVQAAGFKLGNLDVTVVAQTPRLAGFIPQMCDRIAALLKAEMTRVNVKATTTEKLGYVGRKEGIACHAVVLLEALDGRA